MKDIFKSASTLVFALAAVIALNGCATLAVSPLEAPKAAVTRQPASLGVLALGGRMQELLTSPTGSAVNASLEQSFTKVVLLPSETVRESSDEVLRAYGTDYIYTTSTSDVSVAGNLNPIWTISFPLLFFKPFAPIVTFEATVTLDNSVRDTHSDKLLLKRQSSAVVTDHFSPMNPQDKVRNLVSRGINNAMVDFLDEFMAKLDTRNMGE